MTHLAGSKIVYASHIPQRSEPTPAPQRHPRTSTGTPLFDHAELNRDKLVPALCDSAHVVRSRLGYTPKPGAAIAHLCAGLVTVAVIVPEIVRTLPALTEPSSYMWAALLIIGVRAVEASLVYVCYTWPRTSRRFAGAAALIVAANTSALFGLGASFPDVLTLTLLGLVPFWLAQYEPQEVAETSV